MKKTKTKKPEPKTTTQETSENVRAARELNLTLDNLILKAGVANRDETILELRSRLATQAETIGDLQDRVGELREMLRSLGGVIASV